MEFWRCDLAPATVSRLKGYVSTNEFPRAVTVEAPDGTPLEGVRQRASNALVAKMASLGGTYEQDILMALADGDSMRCKPVNAREQD